jgi:hypothetical protein
MVNDAGSLMMKSVTLLAGAGRSLADVALADDARGEDQTRRDHAAFMPTTYRHSGRAGGAEVSNMTPLAQIAATDNL